MDIRYPALLKKENSGYFVEFVDLSDTFTEGETIQEALDNAAEALSAMLTWRIDEKLNIPLPSSDVTGAEYIAPDANTQVALANYRARTERK